MVEEEPQTPSGGQEDERRGDQQGEAGQSEAGAAGGVVGQERLRRLVQRIVWGGGKRTDCKREGEGATASTALVT